MPQKSHFSQSLEHRLYTAEFDDALVDAAHWKNPRYAGSKLTGFKINEYNGTDPSIDKANTSSAEYLGQRVLVEGNSNTVWGGDITYGLNPVINKETTAIYIANTVVGGTENPRYANLEGHSYVGVNKILIVNLEDNTVKVIDRETEDYDSFHRFLTQDFPTGTKLNIKVLDESIQSDLESNYSVRMNKGFLLSTFKYLTYNNNNGTSGSAPAIPKTMQNHQSPLELFDLSDMKDTGGSSAAIDNAIILDTSRLSFRFGYKKDEATGYASYTVGGYNIGVGMNTGFGNGGVLANRDFSPNYSGATIETNKFTKLYYTGSNTFPAENFGYKGAFFSASRFIINDTLNFLKNNFDKTELHLTINKGNIDFAPGFNDERSMSTFEVDKGYGALAGTAFQLNDQTEGCSDIVAPADCANQGGFFDANGNPGGYIGHDTPVHHILQLKGTPPFSPIGNGVSTSEHHICMIETSTDCSLVQVDHERRTFWNGNEHPRIINYSGSAAFELSFLDKDHTLIININRQEELFDGIGTLGMALIPEHLHPTVKSNLEFYLKQGGILTKSTVFQSKK